MNIFSVRKISIFVIIGALMPGIALSQPLTLQQAVALSASNHPLIESRKSERLASDSELTSAKNQFLPTFGLSALRGDSGASQRTATVSQSLWTGGRLTGQLDLARANLRSAEIGINEAEEIITTETVSRFLDLYRAQQNARVATKNIQEHQRLMDIIKRRVAANTSPDVDAMLAMARLQYAESEALQFDNAARSAKSALEQLIGDTFGDIAEPSFEVSITDDVSTLLLRTLDHSPRLEKLQSDTNALKARAQVAKSDIYPQLSLAYEKRFGDILLGQEQEQIYLAFDYKPGAGLSARANAAAANARIRAQQDTLRYTEREIIVQIETLWSQFQAAQRQLSPSQVLAEATTEVVESYLRQYVVGRKSWLDVLNAQRESTQAKYTLINNKVLYLQSYYQLKILSGDSRF